MANQPWSVTLCVRGVSAVGQNVDARRYGVCIARGDRAGFSGSVPADGLGIDVGHG
jgi:hypothetical protein